MALARNRLILAFLCCAVCPSAFADDLTFERDVRPILKTHCFSCHGDGAEVKAGLDLRLRRMIAKGGESGAAIVPSAPNKSLLVKRISLGEMPPEEILHRPSAKEIARIRQWIEQGARTARQEPQQIDADYLTEEERNFWSFRPIVRAAPPPVTDWRRVRTPIDQFVLAKLEGHGLSFAEDADKTKLVRRAYLNLIGLPPSPDDIEVFIRDESPDAYERLIDQLLASSQHGERWGRHWLDVAGYADSEGYTDDDTVRGEAYKYRDYVIRSINSDKPFAQFVIEQLAGDELVAQPFQDLSPDDVDKLVATGFLRMAPDGTGTGGVNQGVARNEVIAKTIQIVSTSLTGLTVGCAQCHNHRYDPISQKDYYRYRAIFEPAFDWKNWLTPQKRRILLYSDTDRDKAKQIEASAKEIEKRRTAKQAEFIENVFQRELAKLEESIRAPIREARNTPKKKRSAEQTQLLKEHPSVNVSAGSLYLYDKKAADELKKLAEQATKLRATKPKQVFLRALWEPPKKTPPETFLFYRGDHEQPKQQLLPSELRVLASGGESVISEADANLPTSGRRLAYAKWLTSGKHPLLARVIVNRVWMQHFGRGIVDTPGDFGALGSAPSHPLLLDWLADEFMQSGWSLKHLHRLIMKSTVYRQGSRGDPKGREVDAQNRLLWQMPVRRLEAEVIRDAMLAISGRLNTKTFGPPVPVMADRVGRFVVGIENLNAGRPGKVIPMKGENLRRSVYIQVRRSRPLSLLESFDAPRMDPNCTSRTSSTVAPQSLMMMNNRQVIEFSRNIATRIQKRVGDDLRAQVHQGWRSILSRDPDSRELNDAIDIVFIVIDMKREP
ncbi:MAG: DUF1553 domain-containing protein [Planctomycetes bacterium]|nr:DUF1553 domain-containing protein [Planctomycetota bacterium]